ncbi:MAG: rhomboid family intramembrane serine protease [Hymenobacter sp.]
MHADWGHLVVQHVCLLLVRRRLVLANATEEGLRPAAAGIWRFLLLYSRRHRCVSDIPTYFRHRDDPSYRSLGASGGVASVLFAGVLLFPSVNGRHHHVSPSRRPSPASLLAFLYLAYSYYMGRRRGDNINHDAHFYGALYGVMCSLLVLFPGALDRRSGSKIQHVTFSHRSENQLII